MPANRQHGAGLESKPSLDLDQERLRTVLEEVLGHSRHISDAALKDVDSLAETIDYMVQETATSGITLVRRAAEDEEDRLELTLQQVESHPLTSLLQSALIDLLAVPEEETLMIISDVLEGYANRAPTKEAGDESEQSSLQKRGGLGECELCERLMPLSEHHLIPRTLHATYARKGTHTLGWLRSRANIAMLCRQCHTAVHNHINHEDLGAKFDTVEKLLEHEAVFKWSSYASKLKERDPSWAGLRLKNKR